MVEQPFTKIGSNRVCSNKTGAKLQPIWHCRCYKPSSLSIISKERSV